MAFQFNISGHTATREAEAEVIKILHAAKQEIAKVAEEVFASVNTQHHGNGSTTEVASRIEQPTQLAGQETQINQQAEQPKQ